MTAEEKEEIRRGRGRPKIPDDQRTFNSSLRLTRERWAKLRRLGLDWLNRQIDRAKEPTPKE